VRVVCFDDSDLPNISVAGGKVKIDDTATDGGENAFNRWFCNNFTRRKVV
jgi:hypothetical protein